ncbi:ABC transporter ATP-binding protein [Allofustis seminis]|uniref:ABC transporter ATP-binding protein n=1 Tax=Allofustis seminis TaxID=166939 RepID=UPI00036446BC|nr:sn-glycerol-3-phosphate ABC transporter ATP-binding protein UgpC [Allofustis seminis]
MGIQLKNIYKKYDGNDFYSVTDFNLDIDDHEFIVFVGPSGCGKSTTLRMVAGLEDITEGDLLIDGKRMNDVDPKDRDIAMVFQNYALYPHMTVYENLAFGLKLRKYDKKEIDSRVRNAAEVLNLSQYLDTKPGGLSGGQRQRVALGRAIVRDAHVFLMDEPLSNLDAKLRVAMRAEIARLHNSLKTTTIYVTHDQTEAMTMADRIVIMDGGEVQQIGTPQEVYNHPVNQFVASFIGSPAMNFFEMKWTEDHLVDEKGLTIPLGAEQIACLKAHHLHENDMVILGIRPENIAVASEMNEGTVAATVTVSELLGAETMLYANYGGEDFIVRVEGQVDYPQGSVVHLVFNVEKALLFHPETKQMLY